MTAAEAPFYHSLRAVIIATENTRIEDGVLISRTQRTRKLHRNRNSCFLLSFVSFVVNLGDRRIGNSRNRCRSRSNLSAISSISFTSLSLNRSSPARINAIRLTRVPRANNRSGHGGCRSVHAIATSPGERPADSRSRAVFQPTQEFAKGAVPGIRMAAAPIIFRQLCRAFAGHCAGEQA